MWYNNQSGANLDGKYINKHVRKKIMATSVLHFKWNVSTSLQQHY